MYMILYYSIYIVLYITNMIFNCLFCISYTWYVKFLNERFIYHIHDMHLLYLYIVYMISKTLFLLYLYITKMIYKVPYCISYSWLLNRLRYLNLYINTMISGGIFRHICIRICSTSTWIYAATALFYRYLTRSMVPKAHIYTGFQGQTYIERPVNMAFYVNLVTVLYKGVCIQGYTNGKTYINKRIYGTLRG